MVSFNCSSSSEKNGKKHLKENSSNPSLKRIKMTNHNYLNLWSVNDCGKTYLRHNKSFVQLALVLGFYERDLAWIKRNILPSFNILKYLERTANHHSGANARYLIVNSAHNMYLIFNGLNSASFFLFSLFSNTNLGNRKNCRLQRDSNWDCWTKRQERWPLDHHQCPVDYILCIGKYMLMMVTK